jgi:hypothetical protein
MRMYAWGRSGLKQKDLACDLLLTAAIMTPPKAKKLPI